MHCTEKCIILDPSAYDIYRPHGRIPNNECHEYSCSDIQCYPLFPGVCRRPGRNSEWQTARASG